MIYQILFFSINITFKNLINDAINEFIFSLVIHYIEKLFVILSRNYTIETNIMLLLVIMSLKEEPILQKLVINWFLFDSIDLVSMAL